MTSLSERALMVTLSVSSWQGRKFDSAETSAVNRKHGLTIQAARVNKALLPKGTELSTLQQVIGTIRKDYERRTLPWGIDGMRILKAEAYMDFSYEVNFWRDQWETAKDDFLRAYPSLKADAFNTLGSLYNPDDYPDVDHLSRLFRFDVKFMPIADEKDWRIDVGDEARAQLEANIRSHLIEVESTAMTAAWSRVQEVVEKMVERLSDPTTIFRNSLVDNAMELCSILPSLNIANDPDLEGVRKTIESTLSRYVGDVDTLRHDPIERTATADKMAEVLRKMAGYMPQRGA